MLSEYEKGNDTQRVKMKRKERILGNRWAFVGWRQVLDEMNGAQDVAPRHLTTSCFNTYNGAICYIPWTLESQMSWPRGRKSQTMPPRPIPQRTKASRMLFPKRIIVQSHLKCFCLAQPCLLVHFQWVSK